MFKRHSRSNSKDSTTSICSAEALAEAKKAQEERDADVKAAEAFAKRLADDYRARMAAAQSERAIAPKDKDKGAE